MVGFELATFWITGNGCEFHYCETDDRKPELKVKSSFSSSYVRSERRKTLQSLFGVLSLCIESNKLFESCVRVLPRLENQFRLTYELLGCVTSPIHETSNN